MDIAKSFAGKVAVITGAAGGLGRATAEALAFAGAAVVLNDLDAERVEAAAAAINAGGGRAAAAPGDVGRPETGEALVATALQALGGIDILINAANIARHLYFAASPLEDWTEVIRTNLLGAVHCSRAAARVFIHGGRTGRIVNVASIHGFLAGPRCSAHDVSMGGLIQLTRSLALELAPHGILVNAVAPGFVDGASASLGPPGEMHEPAFRRNYIDNRRIPLGRSARPEEVVKAILFLAGPDNTYITGVNLIVDGGLSITL